MQQIFKNSTALLDFLNADEPEQYVFRGQIRSYEGPLLPSGLRDRFIPFDASSETSKWCGVTKSTSVIKEEVNARCQDFPPTYLGKNINDVKTIWDLPETAYQMGFRTFYNQPHRPQIRNLGNILREGNVPAISLLIGEDLAHLLCQQYGFTSIALDASTDPSVAMFFATHQAPFYSLVSTSSQMGVIYRWPRERAIIAQDLLLPLEGSDFESIVTSLSNFIKDSADLNVVKDTQVIYTSKTDEIKKREIDIVSEGKLRSNALRFPTGAFNRSRMGRQRAAMLLPDYEVVDALIPRNDEDFRLFDW